MVGFILVGLLTGGIGAHFVSSNMSTDMNDMRHTYEKMDLKNQIEYKYSTMLPANNGDAATQAAVFHAIPVITLLEKEYPDVDKQKLADKTVAAAKTKDGGRENITENELVGILEVCEGKTLSVDEAMIIVANIKEKYKNVEL